MYVYQETIWTHHLLTIIVLLLLNQDIHKERTVKTDGASMYAESCMQF